MRYKWASIGYARLENIPGMIAYQFEASIMLMKWIRNRFLRPQRQGNIHICLRVEARDPDGNLIGVEYKEHDLATKQFAQLIMLNILASNQTITDTGGVGRSETANTAATVPTILAGTTATAATVTDNALGAQTETVSATVNSYSGSGSSGSFTVTGTITATADRAYAEVGLRVTANAHTYLICRDTFSTLNVSNTGTLAVTYTITLS